MEGPYPKRKKVFSYQLKIVCPPVNATIKLEFVEDIDVYDK